MSDTTTPTMPRLSRRQSIQAGALGVAIAGAGVLHLNRDAHAQTVEPDQPKLPPPGPTTSAWMVPLPVPVPKQTVASLNPPPGEYPVEGEAGRFPTRPGPGRRLGNCMRSM
ncbi:hypothetical protein Y695_01446 [Hydrogenophaga sp. T4]|nr:hypothetical protein Y695_01446 [Hydrogenophaga sp. T4]